MWHIVSHMNADFDAMSSMLAALRLYPEARAVFPGSQEERVRRFIADYGPFPIHRLRDSEPASTTGLVVVDTKSASKIGPFGEFAGREGVALHLYDHHPHGQGDIRGSVEVIEPVGATATIFTELLRSRRMRPTTLEATCLMLGIYEETGMLTFAGTTERDLQAAAWLLKHGASLKIVSTYLRAWLSRPELELLSELTHSLRVEVVRGIRVAIVKASIEEYRGDAAHLGQMILEMEGVEGLVMIVRMSAKVLLVARSRVPEFDASRLMAEFEGGGHPWAASASAPDMPLELIEERISQALDEAVRLTKTARDIMTRPVITIEASDSVREAEALMTRAEVNVLPVVGRGRYQGIIMREIVEKALYHGFRESAVTEFMNTEALTASPETSVRDLERAMIEQNQRFMPVLEGESIVGAITRTDLLRTLYEDYLRRSGIRGADDQGGPPGAEEDPQRTKNVASLMRNRLQRDVLALLKEAGEVAGAMGYVAYLAGGPVRDILLGHPGGQMDTDLVVEGDGIAFAHALAARLGGRVRAHQAFKTAKVIAGDLRIDVASARTEYYRSPGALPTVSMSSIKKDLYRRDFTINSLAVRLTPPGFGMLADYFGGRRDIKGRVLRVLHDISLVEDPTRAFRAARFAVRFGFSISKHTRKLIESALKMDLFSKLTGTRLSDEFSLIFEESDPAAIVEMMGQMGLLRVVHPALAYDGRMGARLAGVLGALTWHSLSFLGGGVRRGELCLTALLGGLEGRSRIEEALRRLSEPPKARARIVGSIQAAEELMRLLPLGDDAALFRHMRQVSTEAALYTMAIATDERQKQEISRYLLELRHIRAELTGGDLKAMGLPPGPLYAKILDHLRNQRLRGIVRTREDELAEVRRFMA